MDIPEGFVLLERPPSQTVLALIAEDLKGEKVQETHLIEHNFENNDLLLAALKRAVSEYLQTDDGKKFNAGINGTCNWVDALIEVPTNIWEHNGIKFLEMDLETLEVQADEILT